MAEFLGEAFDEGWRVRIRCNRGSRVGFTKVGNPCRFSGELDMQTLTATRGRAFPLSLLGSRLRCPRCGSQGVSVMFEPPKPAPVIGRIG